jgi:HSP20 family protein
MARDGQGTFANRLNEEYYTMSFRPLQDPQLSLGNLQDEINRLFGRIWHAGLSTGPLDGQQWAPAIDLYEHDDRYTLFAEVPGVDANTIDVTHVGNTLTIKGEKVRPGAIGEGDRSLRNERRLGTFCRNVDLPADMDADRLSAKCQNGVLVITIPKHEASKPKSIKIEIDEG